MDWTIVQYILIGIVLIIAPAIVLGLWKAFLHATLDQIRETIVSTYWLTKGTGDKDAFLEHLEVIRKAAEDKNKKGQ